MASASSGRPSLIADRASVNSALAGPFSTGA
jgi:hypothetical protein